MLKAGNKHPLKESLGVGENSGPSRTKRRRFDNVVLLREEEENSDNLNNGNRQAEPPRQILRAGRKRKKPTEETDHTPGGTSGATGSKTTSTLATPENDENDIISELAKEFKKARLRPVFFTISSFIEQTVGEVGFTMADEPGTEVTVRLNLNLTTIKESKDETTAGEGDIEKEYIGDSGHHFDDLNEEPPDLIKDCSFGTSTGLLQNCVPGSQEYSQIIHRRQEIHQEINNNG